MPVELSVLIATRNRGAWLEKSLLALSRQSLKQETFEVLVSDYGDTAETLRILEGVRLRAPAMRIRHLPLPGGGDPYHALTRARNAAIQAAQGWLLVFLPPECLLTRLALELCLHAHANSPVDLVTTVRPWFVSEKATAQADQAGCIEEPSLFRTKFGADEVNRPPTDKGGPWGDMHFGAVKRRWACWICGHNERFRAWGYESVDFTARLCTYAVEYAEISDERVACFHLWHPVNPSHGDRRVAAVERLLNTLTRDVLSRNLVAMGLLQTAAGHGLNYDEAYHLLFDLPAAKLTELLTTAGRDFDTNVLPHLIRQKQTHRPGSASLGTTLWPGLHHAIQWGDTATAKGWLTLLANENPEDPAPRIELAKLEHPEKTQDVLPDRS